MKRAIIYVECKPDEILVKNLNLNNFEIRHAFGKSNICRYLKENEGLIALMDEDPDANQEPYLGNIKMNSLGRFHLKYGIDENRKNKVIILCPKLEEWIIQACKISKINLEDYDLSSNPIELHTYINSQITKFQQVIHQLIQRKNMMLTELKELITKPIF